MPNLPNVKIDVDRPYSVWDKARDAKQKEIREYQEEIKYYKSQASYIDPDTGMMYFQENYRYDPKTRNLFYPNGSYADGLPPPGAVWRPMDDKLSNRYTLPPLPPARLQNRYTVPTTSEKLHSAVPQLNPEMHLLVLLAKQAGYID